MLKYKNNKTGKVYAYLCGAWNATNGENDGQLMVVYSPEDNENIIYVRESEEFYSKFTEVV